MTKAASAIPYFIGRLRADKSDSTILHNKFRMSLEGTILKTVGDTLKVILP